MAMKYKPSGLMRHSFSVMKVNAASTDLDSYGRTISGSTAHCTIKASFNKLTGNENIIANQEFGKATHDSFCWYVPGINNQMWFIGLDGKRYNIVDVSDIGERKFQLRLVLNCESS